MIPNEENVEDVTRRQSTTQFNTDQCLARMRTLSVADCLTTGEIYVFCPFVLFFFHECFCAHPEREAIIEKTNRLFRETNTFTIEMRSLSQQHIVNDKGA